MNADEVDKPVSVPGHIIKGIPASLVKSNIYETCKQTGKAIIISNFIDGTDAVKYPKHLEKRTYGDKECKALENVLQRLGFEAPTGEQMMHTNVTKSKLLHLCRKVSKENLRPAEGDGYTCILVIAISYGKPGTILCHPEGPNEKYTYVGQKEIQELFQPQHNRTLALKPKLFIFQAIPEGTTRPDHHEDAVKTTPLISIPRESDILTYSYDSFCFYKDESIHNGFMEAVIENLADLANEKEQNKGTQAIEIQKLFIKINKTFAKNRKDNKWGIPLTSSSLTKQLFLF